MLRDDPRSGIAPGLVLITIGGIFLAERLHLGPEWDVEHLWPVFLIVFGVGRMIVTRADGRWGGGLWIAMVGVLLLLHKMDVLQLDRSWPLFIVAGGLAIMFGRRAQSAPRQDGQPDDRH